MQTHRLTGHNVIQLIYPLRHKQKKDKHKSIPQLLRELEWEEIQTSSGSNEQANEEQVHNHNINYLFPSTYYKEFGDHLKKWIPDKQFYSYFHPSVQWNIFHADSKKLRVFRTHTPTSQRFIGEFFGSDDDKTLPLISFEWIASEIYAFSDDCAFLVVRVCLLENVEVVKESNGFQTKIHKQPVQPLSVWAKFVNRVRQNYSKYSSQPRLTICSQNQTHTSDIFFKKMLENIPLGEKICVSNLEASTIDGNKRIEEDSYRIEANAFTHAFVQTDLTEDLDTDELFQLLSIDDDKYESGGTKQFRESFIQDRLYDRWTSVKTYYTAVDYGAVTISHKDQNSYTYSEMPEKKIGYPDLLYQHHCRQYLIFIILQLYYREELQEIMGRYARIPNLDKSKNKEHARAVLEAYYTLNQFFFFDRITHEIQGLELWSFYQKVLKTKELYQAVQQDMNELNQRLIERVSEKQDKRLGMLTILAAITGMFGMNLFIEGFKFTQQDLETGVLNHVSTIFKNYVNFSDFKMLINGIVVFTIAFITIYILVVAARSVWTFLLYLFKKITKHILS